jgi:alpha-glucosidase
MRNTFSTLLVLLCCLANTTPKAAAVSSPDGNLTLEFHITGSNGADTSSGQLIYRLSFHNKPLLNDSALSLDLEGQHPLGPSLYITAAHPSAHNSSYHLITGKASVIRDQYNALALDLDETPGLARRLIIEARVYNDGAAFRYIVPAQRPLREFRLKAENTEFRFAKDATSYALILPNFRSMYESEFVKLPLSAFSNQGGVNSKVLLGLPLLTYIPGAAWMAITEADLRDYSSMYLTNPQPGWSAHWLRSVLAPSLDDDSVVVKGTLPHHSAWRVFLVSDSPASLIQSNIITSLNPASEIADTSWIRPGRASWDWWNGSIGPDGKPAYTTATMKYYVDFAQKSSLEYMLVDAGWYTRGDITKMNGRVDIPDLVRYAKSKNVKVWIWLPYNLADAQMEEAFPLYEKWGVAGLKIDFIERDDQGGIDFYYRAARLAAQHHLMLDFHGATKPTGIERTYPNILGYEAVLGMEQSKGGDRDEPGHHVTLPFTRLLAGPMDYTPGGFRNVTRDQFTPRGILPEVMGTRAHQLAMYAIYQASIQTVSDTPKAYEDQPAFQFIRDAPASWDETVGVNGYPSEYVTVARRHASDWFLGCMTNWDPRTLDIPLTFLGPGKYRAQIYEDAPDAAQFPTNVRVRTMTVDRTTTLKAVLAPGGGYAVRFTPLQ